VKAIAQRASRGVESEQQAAAKRMAKANGEGGEVVGYTFALLAFEAAWEPADLHALLAGAGNAGAASRHDATLNGGGRKTGRRRAVRAGR
jgi:hypothetical protein